MRAAFAPLLLAGLAVANPNPVPAGVSSAIAPSQSPPPGCSGNYKGAFLIAPVNVTSSKRDIDERDLDERNTQLGITLSGGILHDPEGRTGYIASNSQFQFDDPPQAGAIWTAGFSVCSNGRLTLGNDQIWWKCLSGSFSNLYYENQGGQCVKSYIIARPLKAGDGPLPPSVTPSATASATAGSATLPAGSNSTSSSSGVASTTTAVGGGNGTASASGSSSGLASGSSTTVITKGHTTKTAIVGPGHHTKTVAAHTTAGAHKTTTSGGKGTATKGMAASSSSSPAAAPQATLQAGLFGLAAGALAMIAL